jgi:hypothetical protein
MARCGQHACIFAWRFAVWQGGGMTLESRWLYLQLYRRLYLQLYRQLYWQLHLQLYLQLYLQGGLTVHCAVHSSNAQPASLLCRTARRN